MAEPTAQLAASDELATRNVLGTAVAAVTRSEAAAQAMEWAGRGDRAYAIEAADVHVITRARHDADFGTALRRFDMVCPDGMPVVWSVNRQLPEGAKLKERVSGAELMAEVMRQSVTVRDCGHFLLGGTPDLLAILPGKLQTLAPGLGTVTTYSPPFGQWPDDEFARICARIKDSGASHIWVGLGCPKQERWIADHKDLLPPGCYYGVGAAFAFHAGLIDRAPGLFQNLGLEWLYRLCKEPRRLWKRYFTYNSLFLWYSLRGK